MRIFKKITSLVVAFALAFSVGSNVFADENDVQGYNSENYRVINVATGTETIVNANNLPYMGVLFRQICHHQFNH
jgi:hypothetical protein